MNKEEQFAPENSLWLDKANPKDSPLLARTVTRAQLRLAKFIAEREVADFFDVVRAMEKGEHEQVDAWKAEAQRKGPIIVEYAFPKFTGKLRLRNIEIGANDARSIGPDGDNRK